MKDILTPEEIELAKQHREWYYGTIRKRRKLGVVIIILSALGCGVTVAIAIVSGNFFFKVAGFAVMSGLFGVLQVIMPQYIPSNLSDGEIH